MLDVTKKLKILIDIGADLSILKPETCKHYPDRLNGNITVHGIIDEIILIPFTNGNPHKVYIHDLSVS